jgi:glycosyltransferase involved in cell wall biosynthesis
VKIALVGNHGHQQFPLISYGGVESSVETTAWGLHGAGNDFFCVVPRRGPRFPLFRRGARSPAYPFEIIETRHGPTGGSRRKARGFIEEAARIAAAERPDVIWCQGHWSVPPLLELGIPILTTFQDSHEKRPGWMTRHENLFFRFVSRFSYELWAVEDWERECSIHQPTGLVDEEFELAADRDDYFLWVAALSWGWHEKGLDLFVELARRNPSKRFVAYGTGKREIEARLRQVERELSNFQFRGELLRGEPHRNAFKRARAFLMPTQLPEALGRTVLESLSKGTPVLGSANGALPELIADGCGVSTNDFAVLEAALDTDFDFRRSFEHAKLFHVEHEVRKLLRTSENILRGAALGA